MSETAATDEAESTADGDAAGENGVWARQTAPQSPYSMRQVGIGLVIFVIVAAVAFGIPLLLS